MRVLLSSAFVMTLMLTDVHCETTMILLSYDIQLYTVKYTFYLMSVAYDVLLLDKDIIIVKDATDAPLYRLFYNFLEIKNV